MVDKHPGPQAFKRLCGHYIQPSATPVIERLGLAKAIEEAGAVRNGVDIWTSWGLIEFPGTPEERSWGYNLRRSTLDPIIREIAVAPPGGTDRPGHRALELRGGPGSEPPGVELTNRKGERVRGTGRIVIGADGRNSTIARLAGASERRSPNSRFCRSTYFTGVCLPPGSGGRLWMIDHGFAIAAPNDDEVTMLAVFLDKRQRDEFEQDRAAALASFFEALPEAPDMSNAACDGPVLGYNDYDLIVRDPAPRPNVALVGDAGLTSDPTMAIGCGWALQSASWLADALAPALVDGEPLNPALRRYRRERRRNLYGHHRMIAFDARVHNTNPFQRMFVSAAVRDGALGEMILDLGERTIPVRRLVAPSTLTRLGRTKLSGKAAIH